MQKQVGYGKGAFYLDKNGVPVDRRKGNRRVSKEAKRRGIKICT